MSATKISAVSFRKSRWYCYCLRNSQAILYGRFNCPDGRFKAQRADSIAQVADKTAQMADVPAQMADTPPQTVDIHAQMTNLKARRWADLLVQIAQLTIENPNE